MVKHHGTTYENFITKLCYKLIYTQRERCFFGFFLFFVHKTKLIMGFSDCRLTQ